MEKNKTRKYLKYAIGEIILVVIGILIALQINNWNENRKTDEFENQLLIDLQSTLGEDVDKYNRYVKLNIEIKESIEALINHLENGKPYEVSLVNNFSKAHIFYKIILKNHAYIRAKDYGLHFLKKDSINYLLTEIYEFDLDFITEMDDRAQIYHQFTVLPVITELFDSSWGGDGIMGDGKMIPLEYSELKNNKKYLNILKTTHGSWEQRIKWQTRLMKKMKHFEDKVQLLIDE